MRKIMMAMAVLGLSCGAAQAQGVATQNVNLSAVVGGYCTIDGTSTGTARSAIVPVVNGIVTPGALTLPGSSGSVICTSNATIQMITSSKGLTYGTAPADPFVNKIHYTATASYNGKMESLDTTTAAAGVATGGSLTTLGAQTGQPLDLTVTVLPTPTGKFLVNGAYSDTLTIKLTPST